MERHRKKHQKQKWHNTKKHKSKGEKRKGMGDKEFPLSGAMREIFPTFQELLSELRNVGNKSNFGLLFDKYVPELGEGEKVAILEKFIDISNQIWHGSSEIPLGELRGRADAIEYSLKALGYKFSSRALTVAWRMVLGLGTSSVFETGMTFSKIYGFPYIPSSAVKGMAQAYALLEIASEYGIVPLGLKELKEREKQRMKQTPMQKLETILTVEDDNLERTFKALLDDEWVRKNTNLGPTDFEKLKEKRTLFLEIFGSQDRRGKVIFFDALPENLTVINNTERVSILELDIMNPHYKEYYEDKEGKTPPGDYLSPRPIPFLTVREGAKFTFYLSAKDQSLLNQACEWLKNGVSVLGIGAKTRAGYGELG